MDIITIVFLDDSGKKFNPVFEGTQYQEKGFRIIKAESSQDLIDTISNNDFTVIVSCEENDTIIRTKWNKLLTSLTNYVMGRWVNIPDISNLTDSELGSKITGFISTMIASPRSEFMSIVTPVYHTKRHVFERLYKSIKKQTMINWEWVIIDDSKDKSLSSYISGIADSDYRIRYYNMPHSGNIGQVKRTGFMLSDGTWIMEVDHDDELLPDALYKTWLAFQNPDVGFVYSDCIEAEINMYGTITGQRNYLRSSDGSPGVGKWGISGTGEHYPFDFNGTKVIACKSPDINSQTIRHITSMPNHLRCWRADIYKKICGHSPLVHIADDYELMVRTFLETIFCRIGSPQYIQYYEIDGEQNTQYKRNPEIQRMVSLISLGYDNLINERFKQLGADDYCWNGDRGVWWDEFSSDVVKNGKVNLEL